MIPQFCEEPKKYPTEARVASNGLHSIELSAGDFANEKGEALSDWDESTELFFSPSNRIKFIVIQQKIMLFRSSDTTLGSNPYW